MFSWFRKKPKPEEPAPAPAETNEPYPRMGTKIRMAFANGERTWEESADLVEVLARTLEANGHPIAPHDDGLLHKASGMILRPELVGFQPHHPADVSTATIVEARHPSFGETK